MEAVRQNNGTGTGSGSRRRLQSGGTALHISTAFTDSNQKVTMPYDYIPSFLCNSENHQDTSTVGTVQATFTPYLVANYTVSETGVYRFDMDFVVDPLYKNRDNDIGRWCGWWTDQIVTGFQFFAPYSNAGHHNNAYLRIRGRLPQGTVVGGSIEQSVSISGGDGPSVGFDAGVSTTYDFRDIESSAHHRVQAYGSASYYADVKFSGCDQASAFQGAANTARTSWIAQVSVFVEVKHGYKVSLPPSSNPYDTIDRNINWPLVHDFKKGFYKGAGSNTGEDAVQVRFSRPQYSWQNQNSYFINCIVGGRGYYV
mmetsp:Transcript_6275/g.8162  ORF Transcript_6275/g.8162 Transcript_6275/m.8162 type:complete len:312 (-) Transcript_6275:32-967(-)